MSARYETWALALIGAWLGFVLSRAGFSSWDEVNAMFRLQSFRLVLAFAGAVVALCLGWWVIRRLTQPRWSDRRFHPGTIPGAMMFGVGWVLSGACPSIALVQLGEGKLLAFVTLAGVFIGNYGYSWLHERHLRWSASACGDD